MVLTDLSEMRCIVHPRGTKRWLILATVRKNGGQIMTLTRKSMSGSPFERPWKTSIRLPSALARTELPLVAQSEPAPLHYLHISTDLCSITMIGTTQ